MKLKAYLAMIDGKILENVCMHERKAADVESTGYEEGIPTIKTFFIAFDINSQKKNNYKIEQNLPVT